MILRNLGKPDPNRDHHNGQRPRFPLGRIVMTPGAIRAFGETGEQPADFLARHVTGDWGDLGNADKEANDEDCGYEGKPDRQQRILSAYRTAKGVKFWIITEGDRSATTFLLPSEY